MTEMVYYSKKISTFNFNNITINTMNPSVICLCEITFSYFVILTLLNVFGVRVVSVINTGVLMSANKHSNDRIYVKYES